MPNSQPPANVEGAGIPGTVFPALYADDPAGGTNQAQDITDLPLPDMSDGIAPSRQGLSTVPEDMVPPNTPAGEKAAIEDLGDGGPQGRKKRTYQDRIDQLTRRYHDTREENSNLTNQLNQLAEIVSAQQNQLKSLRASPITPPAQPGEFGSMLNSGEPPPAGAVAPSGSLDIDGIISQAIGRYDQKRRNEDAQVGNFRNEQEKSFALASEEFPELSDQRTTFRRAFNELFDKSPLKNLPDGPYHVALQVRGILADEASRTTRVTERKRLASTVVPTPSTTDSPEISRGALQKELEKVNAELRAGNTDFNVYRKWRMIREQLRKSQ